VVWWKQVARAVPVRRGCAVADAQQRALVLLRPRRRGA